MKRTLRSFALLLSLVLLFAAAIPASAQSEDEAWDQYMQENTPSHAATGHFEGEDPLRDKHQIGNPKKVVDTLRIGLRYSYTPTGGKSEFYSVNHPSVKLTGTAGTFTVKDLATGAVIATGNAGDVYTVSHNGTGYVVTDATGAEVATVAGPVRFSGTDPNNAFKVPSLYRTNVITWVGTVTPEYWGEMEIARGASTAAGYVNVVNIVEMETYLRGNVVNESPAYFAKEALKAQATVARGYAVANVGRWVKMGYPFDLDDSASSQVYRGKTSEHPNGNAAVAETTGLVVAYDGKIISAFYSSSMGGFTENVEWSFSSVGDPTQAKPWLVGRYDGPAGTEPDLSTEAGIRDFWANEQPQVYDSKAISGNPRNRWQYTYSAAVAATKLNAAKTGRVVISGSATSIGTLTNVAVVERSPSGRAVVVRFTGTAAVWEYRNWGNVRSALQHPSWGTLDNPAFYDMTYNPDGSLATVTVVGGGWGHNVGMSQYGANGRGNSGQSFTEILNFYYKDTVVGSYPIDIDRDPSVSPRVWRQHVVTPSGRGVLEIRQDLSAGQIEGLQVTINGSKEVHLQKADLNQPLVKVDVSQFLTVGENVIDYKIQGSDGAVTIMMGVNE
jgi:SpoIID/LytB domain protein